LPIVVRGDPRAVRLATPEAEPGAPCGLVDLLDFPLDPPDGVKARSGLYSFGLLSGRYDKYHAGEDWSMATGLTVGAPVHSIGHGQVTYAEPLGWNADRGVVIVRHVFADGSTFLSFYGHLDPISVRLQAGACVQRGQEVGRIGRPRSPPHLHFEIRSHMPTQPGPGYWASDPIAAGWKPPSPTIWKQRMMTSPGVAWVWSEVNGRVGNLDTLGPATVIATTGRDVIGMGADDGSLQWRLAGLDRVDDAIISADGSTVYIVSQPGQLRAYQAARAREGTAAASAEPSSALLWEVKLSAVGMPALLPLPDGGVVVWAWQRMLGVSAKGAVLWDRRLDASLSDWVAVEDGLILTTTGKEADLWTVDASGAKPWGLGLDGNLSGGVGDLFVHDRESIYRLDPQNRSAEMFYAVPKAYPGLLDVLVLLDGGLLVAHSDRSTSRLLTLDRGGAMRWQRAYDGVVAGQPRLLPLGDEVYVLFEVDRPTSATVALYALDLPVGGLVQLFDGGTSDPGPESTSLMAMDDGRVLINIRGAALVALDPQEARGAVLTTGDSSARE
jgi:hypothetical protein